jgi:hypothetical protein
MSLGAIIGRAVLGQAELAKIPTEEADTGERILEPTRGNDNFLTGGRK